MQRFLVIFSVLFLGFSLNACSNSAKQALGLSRKSPDEFTVISRAPLTVPPVFNMRPPKLGETRPQEAPPVEVAKQSLISNEATEQTSVPPTVETTEKTSGESYLLSKAGAEQASSDIRKVVDQEATSLVEESTGFVEKIVFWKKPEDPTALEVDPKLEAKRIQENNALGQSITTGITPVIERKRKGFFEK